MTYLAFKLDSFEFLRSRIREMVTEPSTEIVLPHAAGYILGYTRSEMAILIEFGVITHLIRRAGCSFYYRRSELLAFREEVRTNAELAACVNYFLSKDQEN